MRFECNLNEAASQFEFTFHRLITIGDAGNHDRLAPPASVVELAAEEINSVVFDKHLGFEVDSRVNSERLVAGAGVAVGAAVLAAAVRIHAVTETDIGAVVFSDE